MNLRPNDAVVGGSLQRDPASACRVCDALLAPEEPGIPPVCGRCGRWPRPLLDAHLEADDESRERVKVRLIAAGNTQHEFRACRIAGDWLAVDDTRCGQTFWVAREHIVTVWEERV